MHSKLPDHYEIPNPYKIPVHDQQGLNNCTSHALALCLEYYLSDCLKERVEIDVIDLWNKQLKYGTASEQGDTLEDAIFIADKFGVLFKTINGRKGIFKMSEGIEFF